ncbi:amidohydrolase family protein [Kineobactrum salinum]|uniref:Amidohydrolase n=1 Tax=Kineobactrum salinum TaxID=2708301 RepID=A0A6C0U2Y4_9GAMM|nr:amidohydrolase family protein [Kineobactrum salinum]QIB65327.1 amidohydrolase [Kineobactrum salinum]
MPGKLLHDPLGQRLPIKLDTTSNGEFLPVPLARIHHRANALAQSLATSNARRRGLGRRNFLVSACGAATTLLAFNSAFAATGRRGGYFELEAEAALDPQLASARLDGREFIFDVQGHFVNPDGRWTRQLPDDARPLQSMPKASCAAGEGPGRAYLDCLNSEQFVQDVFMDSDTDLMVLSFVPSRADAEPLTIEEAAATADLVERLDGTHRLLLHGRVNPNQDGDLEAMDQLAERWGVCAWKTYTQWGPDGRGFWLDDEDSGIPFLEKARQLGVKIVAVHKGLPFGQQSYEHSTCADIGRVARRYPDISFLVYHSGFVTGSAEGPYDPERSDGVDSLVTSLRENGIAPNSNVYAELGSTWRYLLRDPDSAAHTLGKLFLAVGEDNVLWGTDSIWYGSPQDQIQAFRSFQIAEPLREQYGYPQMTPQLRAKVFGLNALKPYGKYVSDLLPGFGLDRVATLRAEYRQQPDPHFRTYGPRTRREFFNLMRWQQS